MNLLLGFVTALSQSTPKNNSVEEDCYCDGWCGKLLTGCCEDPEDALCAECLEIQRSINTN